MMLCAVAGASAQYEYNRTPWWYTLESGKDMFRQGAYGDALIAFQDARNERRDMYSKMEESLIMFLSTPEARRLNYSLDALEQLAREDGQLGVLRVLDEVYYRIGRGVLGNSARNVLAQLDRLKSYPEADYWIGEVYRLTGEYEISLRQFDAAIRYEDCLENPDFAVEIVYKMAEIERLRQNYNGMEERLLSILERDTLWGEDEGGFVREAMDRTLYTSGVNRFLQMYRYRNAFTERAHRILGEYYYTSGRHGRAVSHMTFAFLIQNTVIIEEAIAARFDFKFTSLEELMIELERRKDVKAYMAERDYYRTIYYLAAALYANGREVPARELWDFLSGRAEAGEWQGRARSQLRSPSIDAPAR
jgi:tetratricopeptide (TPR) repeat protein